MATDQAKKTAQDFLLLVMYAAIVKSKARDLDNRIEEQQFRRVERLFGHKPGTWPLRSIIREAAQEQKNTFVQ